VCKVTRHFIINGVIYSRTQYPIQNAFALTVHKTQSLSLPRITLSLDSSLFSTGQAYTALSRGTTLAGLSIAHLDHNAFIVDQNAVKECELLKQRWRRYITARDSRRANSNFNRN